MPRPDPAGWAGFRAIRPSARSEFDPDRVGFPYEPSPIGERPRPRRAEWSGSPLMLRGGLLARFARLHAVAPPFDRAQGAL
jgi:hypothetical protein